MIDLKQLFESIEKKGTKELNLSKEINDEQAVVLAGLLANNACIQKLNIATCQIEQRGIQAIAKALEKNVTLKDINLSLNNLGPEGGILIAEALKVNKTLTKIDLNSTNLDVEGGNAIASALKINKTLKTIDLTGNNLGVEGGKAIAEMLNINRTLTILYLGENDFLGEEMKDIFETLKVNRTLTGIYLGNNNIGVEVGKVILDVFNVNKSLTEIDLGDFNTGGIIPKLIQRNKNIQATRNKIAQLFSDASYLFEEDGSERTETFNTHCYNSILESCGKFKNLGYPEIFIQELQDEAMLARCSWDTEDTLDLKIKMLKEILSHSQDVSLKEKSYSFLAQTLFNQGMNSYMRDKEEAKPFFLQAYMCGLHRLEVDKEGLDLMSKALCFWFDIVDFNKSLTQLLIEFSNANLEKFKIFEDAYKKNCADLGLTPKSLSEIQRKFSNESCMGLVPSENLKSLPTTLVFSAAASKQYNPAEERKVSVEEKEQASRKIQEAVSLDEDADIQTAVAASLSAAGSMSLSEESKGAGSASGTSKEKIDENAEVVAGKRVKQ